MNTTCPPRRGAGDDSSPADGRSSARMRVLRTSLTHQSSTTSHNTRGTEPADGRQAAAPHELITTDALTPAVDQARGPSPCLPTEGNHVPVDSSEGTRRRRLSSRTDSDGETPCQERRDAPS